MYNYMIVITIDAKLMLYVRFIQLRYIKIKQVSTQRINIKGLINSFDRPI